jgi:hypothetical protein
VVGGCVRLDAAGRIGAGSTTECSNEKWKTGCLVTARDRSIAPELDPAFTDKQVLLAFLKNGKPLDEKEGPYRIVIPSDKKMARWVRQVTTLKIVDVQ